ncbi:MAG: aryl-sulfate sulfotransferase, partial [Promethearchaeota archaeon]
DGTTMISLRNFDKVIIVNTTDTGEILWEYGEYGNYSLCRHQHNPEYTAQGTILIADSENNRIIEVNMTTKDIIWEYVPTGDEALSWPRDADILPNGNMLISDSARMGGYNRIWEIDIESKEVVWYFDTSNANYDADRLDTTLPIINIKSPINTTYEGSISITISLENEDPWYDKMYYRIFDNTDNNWLTMENVTYLGPTQVLLENLHSYSLHVWAKDIVMEGGAYPTSRAIIQRDYESVEFTVKLSTQYDPSKPFPGNTLISHYLREVSPEGDVLWSYIPEGKITWDAERLPNGNYLFSICDDYHIDPNVPLVDNIIEMTPDYEVVWNYTIYGPLTSNHEIHDVDKLPNGNYLIADMSQDRVIEVNSTYDIIWEWRCIDHLRVPDPIPEDWVHLNDVDRLPNGNTLMTLRNYDSIIEVNPEGDIVWSYGDLVYDMALLPINHTVLWGPHNADRLSNGHTMVADSRNRRILEIDMLGNVVWELNSSHIDLWWPRDCDKLPNGNVLIADSLNNRIIEVNSTYDIVWEYISTELTYEADRIDLTAPTLNINSPIQNDISNGTVIVDISSPDLDTDTVWYGFLNETSSDWVDLTSQGGNRDYQIYEGDPDIWLLEDGEYTLWVWANDTGYPMLGSDQHINIREVQVYFEVGFGLNILNPISNQIFSNSPFDFEIIIRIEGTLDTTWYTLDNGMHNYTFIGLTGTINQSAWDAKSDGEITVRFYAKNTVGIEFFDEVTIFKDTIAPLTTISFILYSGSNNVLKSTLFNLTADDGFGSGIAKIRYRIGNGSWIDYVSLFSLSDYAFGTYIISFYAIDNANNTESIKYITINLVDTKQERTDPFVIFAIVISISAVAVTSVVIFYILRKKLIAQSEHKPEVE